MSETVNNQVNEEVEQVKVVETSNSGNNNKRLLLWGILIVVVAIVLYVLFYENKEEKVRLNTEVRNMLPSPSVSDVTTVATPASTLTIGGDSSEVRNQLANLFRSYA